MKFKVGDKVKVSKEKGQVGLNSWTNDNFGCIGMITIVDDSCEIFPYFVEFDDPNNQEEDLYNEDELEPIKEKSNKTISEYKIVSNKHIHFFALEVNNVLEEGFDFLSELKIIIDSIGNLIYIREFVKYN